MSKKILEVNDLHVSFDTYAGEVKAVRGISFYVNKGETLGVVGESGCGKSVTIQTVMKLIPMPPARIKSGSIIYKGQDITTYNDKQMRPLRGKEMAMIFQDPMTSLNPTTKIGRQITEVLFEHEKIEKKAAEERAIEMMRLVGIPNPDLNMVRYPHTYSGGMRQRIMIAIAMACEPNIVFADEPTTALDVTMQIQILELMNSIKKRMGTAIVLITHDLGVIARMAERIAVMYAGEIVETGNANEIFYNPKHPYTWGLLGSMPDTSEGKKKQLNSILGTPPDLISPPKGCGFASRCKYCMEICKEITPPTAEYENEHKIKCWLTDARAPKIEPPKIKKRKNMEIDYE